MIIFPFFCIIFWDGFRQQSTLLFSVYKTLFIFFLMALEAWRNLFSYFYIIGYFFHHVIINVLLSRKMKKWMLIWIKIQTFTVPNAKIWNSWGIEFYFKIILILFSIYHENIGIYYIIIILKSPKDKRKSDLLSLSLA